MQMNVGEVTEAENDIASALEAPNFSDEVVGRLLRAIPLRCHVNQSGL